MINLTREQIEISLTRVEGGLTKYCWLQTNLIKTDISVDQIFKKKYIHFYRIRRNMIWQQHYFSLLERAKYQEITFEKALNEIKLNTGRYESSFVSKLVATINPKMPVIDQFVLKNVGLRLPYATATNRKNRIIEVYENLIREFQVFLETEMGAYLVKKFKENFPAANITRTKMVDLVLWQTR
jgi:hypothetical protein